MRVTKRQLKNIIKEEIEATLQEQDGDKMAKAQELAQVLAQSPAVMAAVQQAAKDPKVQAAAQEGAIQEADFMPTNQQLSDTAMATGIGGGAIMMIGAAAVATPAVFALGLTGGVALMAMGILVSQIVEQ